MWLSFNTIYLTMCDFISQRLCCTKRGSSDIYEASRMTVHLNAELYCTTTF